MSDEEKPQVQSDKQRENYDFIFSAIQFTKICAQQCNVLKGNDDRLEDSEEACLSKL